MRQTIARYYRLTKPGIVRGNVITAIAGFLYASQGNIQLSLFAAIIVGTALIIASGCVANNYIDRNIDAAMVRTKKRGTATGDVGAIQAIGFSAVLGIIGLIILATQTNLLTVIIGLIGFIDYVVLYGIAKRSGPISTLVGSISGSTSIVAGYTAVTNELDAAAILLFLVLATWQMPHFYAIAIYRQKDYAAAKLPTLPAVKGMLATKREAVFYGVLFIVATTLLYILSQASIVYLCVVLVVSLWWLYHIAKGFSAKDDVAWAKKIFRQSLIVLLVFSIMISLSPYII